MTTSIHKTILALLATLSLIAVSSASASHPKALLVSPGFNPSPIYNDLPRFGFSSFNIQGYGERITNVRWGGIAQRMGLEPGDVILSVNGYPLSYHGSWNDALRQAVYSGGWVQLRIRDVRTGYLAEREIFVGDGGIGPVTPHSHVAAYHGPITTKKTMPQNHHPQQNLNGPQQIKKLVDMFDKKNSP